MSHPARTRRRSVYEVTRENTTPSWQPEPDYVTRRHAHTPEMTEIPLSFAEMYPGENHLCLAVIKQAMRDALGIGRRLQPWDIDEARAWLHSPAFLAWCETFGLPGEAIAKRFRREVAQSFDNGHEMC